MSAILAAIQAQAALAAQTGPNMTEAVKGGGGGRLLPEGYAFGRLVEYVEFGNQPQEFEGKAKDPALEFQLGFALTGEGYSNEDGTPYILRPFSMAMSRNDKAKAFLLFKALNWKGTATHFAQLLGEAFLVKIATYKPKDTTKKPSSNIDLKGFLPPLDPVTKTPYPIAAARDEDFKIFLWDHPSIEGWDALFIEGAFDDGKSKNFVQAKVLSALDFSGSALEQLLVTSGKSFSRPVTAPQAAAPAAPAAAVAPTQPASPALPTAPSVPTAAVPIAPVAANDPPFPAPHQAVAPTAQATLPVQPVATPAVPTMPKLPAMPVMPQLPKVA